MLRIVLCGFFALFIGVNAYNGYQVLRTAPLKDITDVMKVKPLTANINYDFWSYPHVGSETDIMTSPEHVAELWDELTRLGLEPSVLIPDVAVTVARERHAIEERRKKRMGKAPDFTTYLTLDEIDAYLDEVVSLYPAIASLESTWNSYENKPIRVLKLSNGAGKTGMFLEATIHARDWMGSQVVLYAIKQLTENLVENQAMLDKNDFYFLPIANPDGYSFSWSETNYRLWRKTRSPNPGYTCIGTDANRNYNFHWADVVRTPCDDTYQGISAFSENEARGIADFLTATPAITMYLSFDSYGQKLMYPWGYTYLLPPGFPEVDDLSYAVRYAIENVRGTVYDVGSVNNVYFQMDGLNIDYANEMNKIDFSYTMYLPAGGLYGFNPPPEDIMPVVTETWAGIKVLAGSIPAKRRS